LGWLRCFIAGRRTIRMVVAVALKFPRESSFVASFGSKRLLVGSE
jgi:hypothetical protein